MRLNHLNLCSSDVPLLARVLEQHLDHRVLEIGTVPDAPWAPNPGAAYAMLQGSDGSYTVISEIDAPAEGRSAYPAGFHFGLLQDSARAVEAKHAELEAAGLGPRAISRFSVLGADWTAFTCPLGDGLEVEINHRTESDVLDAGTA